MSLEEELAYCLASLMQLRRTGRNSALVFDVFEDFQKLDMLKLQGLRLCLYGTEFEVPSSSMVDVRLLFSTIPQVR